VAKSKTLSKNKTAQPGVTTAEKRSTAVYFDKYSGSYQTTAQKIIQWVCVPLIMFSLLGLVWATPFPYIKFLGAYNGFFNWASFLIAISIYYYYKISPPLSYPVFIVLFGFSYGIMQLEQWHKNGGPALGIICLIVFIVAASAQFAKLQIKSKKPSLADGFRFLIISPVWLLHFVFRRFSIRY
jgi:hypothetical protein